MNLDSCFRFYRLLWKRKVVVVLGIGIVVGVVVGMLVSIVLCRGLRVSYSRVSFKILLVLYSKGWLFRKLDGLFRKLS